MKSGCIVASTPFQVLSACAIAEQNKDISFDLYIIGNFPSYKRVEDFLQTTSFFENITSYELSSIRKFNKRKRGIIRSFGSLIGFISYNRIIPKIIKKDREYEYVFYAAALSAIELLFYCKRHFNSKFVMYDDGVMTYRNVNHCMGNEGKLYYIKKYFEDKYGRLNPSLLLYMPKLFNKLNGDNYQVELLKPMSDNVQNLIKKMYSIGDDTKIKEKLIVLECKVDDYLKSSEDKEIEKIYKIIDDKYPSEIIYKRHPRDIRKVNSNRKYLEGQIPYEVYNMIQNMENKVILAWDSTATLTPKLFFGQEPTVILMYKIYPGQRERIDSDTQKLYSAFKEEYSDPNRFLIPDTKEELVLYLTKEGLIN